MGKAEAYNPLLSIEGAINSERPGSLQAFRAVRLTSLLSLHDVPAPSVDIETLLDAHRIQTPELFS